MNEGIWIKVEDFKGKRMRRYGGDRDYLIFERREGRKREKGK